VVITFRHLPQRPQNVKPLNVEVEAMPDDQEHTSDLDALLETIRNHMWEATLKLTSIAEWPATRDVYLPSAADHLRQLRPLLDDALPLLPLKPPTKED
jgi:hypothetical protein